MLDRATSALLDTLAVGEQGGERVYLGGTANVLRLPEFQDVERLRQVLGLLERDASLLRLLEERIGQTGVRVTIGSENGAPEMRGCSLATTTYRAARGGTGLLGLLGPTRMDYRRVTTLLDVVRRQLDGLLDG
jgi:heat-inducible transcriptional repressor